MRQQLFRMVLVFLVVSISTQLASGQATTASISGTVRDSTGAVLPGVSVSIKNVDTQITRTAVTGEEGRYVATNLSLGTYEVQGELPGFQTAVRSGITLTVGREAIVNLVLTVGEITEKVVVTGEAPLVDTSSSAVGGVIETRQIADLPINARSFDKLARLEVAVGLAKRGGTSNAIGGTTDKISIAGGRITSNLFLLDGTDISDKRGTSPGGSSGSALGMEAVREFRVLTSNYGAQYGRAVGGIVEVATKSGTNEFHGSTFFYHRNDNFDARDFFDVEEPPEFKRNQFGFSLGGPLVKDKSFFFGNYEGLRERLGRTVSPTVPDADARRGILAGRAVPVAESVKPYLALYPLPNGRLFPNGTGEFVISVTNQTTQDYFMVRGDHHFSQSHSIMGRFTFDDADVVSPHSPPVSSGVQASRSRIITLEDTYIFSPEWLNKFRFGLNRSVVLDANEPQDIPSSLDWVPGKGLLTSGQLVVRGIASLGGNRFVPNGFAWNSFQWADDLSYVRSRHSLKTGAVVQRIQYNHRGADANSGEFLFNSLELFLRGQPRSFVVQSAGTRDRWLRQTLFGTYVQDDFAVRTNLTLNLGIRLEFITSPVEKFGQTSNLRNVADSQLTVGNPLFETSKNNWAPRVGFAWDPTGKSTTSLRGGFGLFYDQPVPTYWYMVAQHNPPFAVRATVESAPFPNAWEIARTITAVDLRRQETRSMVYTGTGYSMRYNLMLQRQVAEEMVVSLGYMGSQARKLIRRSQVNTKPGVILPDGRKFFPADQPRRNPNLSDVEQLTNDVNSNYNALVTSLRKRYGRGFQFQVSYTFSKALSVQDRIPGGEIGGRLMLLDAYDPKRDHGPAEHDVRQTLVVNYTYDLPFGRNATGATAKFLTGWQVGGIVTAATGAPFEVESQFLVDGSVTSRAVNRPDLRAGGSLRPILGGPDQYFDPFHFERSQPGFYGNVGRNTLTDPGLVTADLSIVKNTALSEEVQIQFRSEFFNILNRPNFGTPAVSLFDGAGNRLPTAGRIRSTVGTSREIQFGLRLLF